MPFEEPWPLPLRGSKLGRMAHPQRLITQVSTFRSIREVFGTGLSVLEAARGTTESVLESLRGPVLECVGTLHRNRILETSRSYESIHDSSKSITVSCGGKPSPLSRGAPGVTWNLERDYSRRDPARDTNANTCRRGPQVNEVRDQLPTLLEHFPERKRFLDLMGFM